MRPPEEHRTVSTSGIMDDVEFGISQEDQSWVLHILRNQIYSNKVLAVLREYACNAKDANRDVPIEVTFPTVLDPQLVIRDRGPGLSYEDMFRIYTQYGKSTKRDDDGLHHSLVPRRCVHDVRGLHQREGRQHLSPDVGLPHGRNGRGDHGARAGRGSPQVRD